ncbi:Sas10/Utp3/C1D family-domain-containing protein [Hypoxylon argillaceum]|nr:Sas10/Utp3/C1D family-domain-containing protein [Hypoxylon argillaceum]KAI1149933.1 Sas10/Utp3/C1D family-domain-containing protein [Nemania diffusa]
MDPSNVLPLVELLDESLDTLTEAATGLSDGIHDMASKLPLLDKAKLYVLMTYAVESILFSTLRLNGVDAKEHDVYKELVRVRNYFEKIKAVEFPPEKPRQSLNKEAAIRFIRSDLADHKEINLKLTEMIAKERAMAAVKASKLGQKRRLDAGTTEEKPGEKPESTGSNLVEKSAEEVAEEATPEVEPQPQKKKPKKEKRDKSEEKGEEGKEEKEKKHKKKKKNRKLSKD